MSVTENEAVHRLPRGRPRLDPDLRKTSIVETALRVFIEVGFVDATMEMIAARCAISKATLYSAFSSKRDLFTSVVEVAVRLEIPDEIEGGSVAKTLETILLPPSDGHESELDDRDAILRIVYTQGQDHPELWEIYRCTTSKESERLTAWLLLQQAQGRLIIDDATMIAQMLMNVALGYPPNRSEAVVGPLTRVPYLREFVTIFCRGISVS
ncbi:TetR/AcrR family transcriptional regulator [Rhizobium tumorigenes]|uniref:TetR/AcrR family transcriptional regulator n=1 Tax=Rhizobium tumorigenes TaxID=2041385 RepID=UPI00241CF645|nr:TetR/AcrR family transcriptional regulator [Rhizobium tumorigenes]WFS04412.1 helix-turn-helix domain containing protein [Rhizobium tumorigenes]